MGRSRELVMNKGHLGRPRPTTGPCLEMGASWYRLDRDVGVKIWSLQQGSR